MIRALLLSIFAGVFLIGCGNTEIATTGVNSIQTSPNTNQTETGNPIISNASINFSAFPDMSGVSEIRMCLDRMRFRRDDDSDNRDVDLYDVGYISISASGTTINGVNFPIGTFEKVEFELASNCDGLSSPSLYVDNDNDGGTPFQTNDPIEISFRGQINITDNSSLNISLTNLIANLADVTSNSELKDAAEDASSEGEADKD